MKFLKLLGKWLSGTCIYFTSLTVPFILLNALTADNPEKILSIGPNILMLPAAACISAAGILFVAKNVPSWLRGLGHYAITVASLMIFLYFPNNMDRRASAALIVAVSLSVAYWIVFAIVHLIRKRILRLLEETSE